MRNKTIRANHAPYVTKTMKNSKENSLVDYTKDRKRNTLINLI